MKTYNNLKIENQSNTKVLELIEEMAGKAIDYVVAECEYGIEEIYLTDNGTLKVYVVNDLEISDKEVSEKMQVIFDQKFQELFNESI